jgi:hypothetical protein
MDCLSLNNQPLRCSCRSRSVVLFRVQNSVGAGVTIIWRPPIEGSSKSRCHGPEPRECEEQLRTKDVSNPVETVSLTLKAETAGMWLRCASSCGSRMGLRRWQKMHRTKGAVAQEISRSNALCIGWLFCERQARRPFVVPAIAHSPGGTVIPSA